MVSLPPFLKVRICLSAALQHQRMREKQANARGERGRERDSERGRVDREREIDVHLCVCIYIYTHICGTRPLCSLNLGKKWRHFSMHLLRNGPDKWTPKPLPKIHFLLVLQSSSFPLRRQKGLFQRKEIGSIYTYICSGVIIRLVQAWFFLSCSLVQVCIGIHCLSNNFFIGVSTLCVEKIARKQKLMVIIWLKLAIFWTPSLDQIRTLTWTR